MRRCVGSALHGVDPRSVGRRYKLVPVRVGQRDLRIANRTPRSVAQYAGHDGEVVAEVLALDVFPGDEDLDHVVTGAVDVVGRMDARRR